jgi:uncharacterized protein (TIGR03067 family)
MRTFTLSVLLSLAVGSTLAAPAPYDGYERAARLHQIQGEWQIVYVATDRDVFAPGGIFGGVIIRNDRWLPQGPHEGPPSEATIRLWPGEPERIDMTNVYGRASRGIYATTGDTLRICVTHTSTAGRPTFFAPTRKWDTLFVLRRR